MINTKIALIYTYAHLPEKVMYLANPPEDITNDKYSDIWYMSKVIESIEELSEKDFDDRSDGVCPYSKETIIMHFKNRIKEIEGQ